MATPSSIGNKSIVLPVMQPAIGKTVALAPGTASTEYAIEAGKAYRIFATSNALRFGFLAQGTAPGTATVGVVNATGMTYMDFQLPAVSGTALHVVGDNAASAGVLVQHQE